MTDEHAPAMQQAPRHGLGAHVPPVVNVPAQAAWVVEEHTPATQHAPRHGFGEHTPFAVKDPVHRVVTVRVHVPLAAQQEPKTIVTFATYWSNAPFAPLGLSPVMLELSAHTG